MSCVRYKCPHTRQLILSGKLPSWLEKHPRRAYIIAAILATPPWIKRKELRPFEIEAQRKTVETGVKHTIDHVIPLTHPLVCGLTVPWNLRVVPQKVNGHKGNTWHGHQLELFVKEQH